MLYSINITVLFPSLPFDLKKHHFIKKNFQGTDCMGSEEALIGRMGMNDQERKSPKRVRIMVVDDFSGMRTILKHTLHLLGFEQVVEARGGQDALDKLRQSPCELIISDWAMPQMSGLEFHSALRSSPELRNVPFLLITAKSERDNVIEAAHAGVTPYMIKPFSAEALQEKILNILDAQL